MILVSAEVWRHSLSAPIQDSVLAVLSRPNQEAQEVKTVWTSAAGTAAG